MERKEEKTASMQKCSTRMKMWEVMSLNNLSNLDELIMNVSVQMRDMINSFFQ